MSSWTCTRFPGRSHGLDLHHAPAQIALDQVSHVDCASIAGFREVTTRNRNVWDWFDVRYSTTQQLQQPESNRIEIGPNKRKSKEQDRVHLDKGCPKTPGDAFDIPGFDVVAAELA